MKKGHVYHTLARCSVINPIYPLLVHKISGNGHILPVLIVFPAYCTFIHQRKFWMWLTQVFFFPLSSTSSFLNHGFVVLKKKNKKKNSLQVSYSSANFTATLFRSLDAGSLSLLLEVMLCWVFCMSARLRLIPNSRRWCFVRGEGRKKKHL